MIGLTVTERVIAETWIVKFRSIALCVSEQVYRGRTRVLLNRRYVSPTVSKSSLAATEFDELGQSALWISKRSSRV